jgi:hypothetical protein
MHGIVTSYSGTTLVVNVETVDGSGGPFTAWTINVGGLLTAQGALLEVNNLSDVSNPATALTNIGGVPTSRSISAGTGLTGGGDFTANRTLTVSYGTTSGTACQGNDARLSDARTPLSHTHGNLTNDGKVGTTANLPLKTGTNGVVEAGSFGTAAGSFCEGNDARLSDDRDPNLHAASHLPDGADEIFDQNLNTTDSPTFGGLTAGTWTSVTGEMVVGFQDNSLEVTAEEELAFEVFAGLIKLRDWENDFKATFLAADKLSADQTYDIPNQSGTLALTSDIPTTASDIGAAASGSITTSGLTPTARLIGRTSSGVGAPEEIQIGSGLSLSAGELSATSSGGVTAVGPSTADVLSVSGSDLVADDPNADRIVFWDDSEGKLRYLEAGSGLTISGTTMTATASGGIGGGTGSTDNSILRSDGTGGSTVQDSALVIDDATTSTQANVALANNHSETNSSLVLRPKGNGAFILLKPDGTTANGNARGQFAVDLQLETNAAARVASGNYSFAVGRRCTASGLHSVAIGEQCLAGSASYTISLGRAATASANGAICFSGDTCTASGQETFVAGGNQNTASASSSMTLGGDYAVSDRGGMVAQANGRFAANGDAQWIHIVLRAKTTTNAAVELLINSARVTNGRLTCPSGKIISGIINIHGVKSDGTASAHYVRQFQVKNVAGTSSYPYTAATIGTDFASSTSITFNDPDANGDALSVSVTGIASEIWRWTGHVSAVETAYGT